MSADTRPPGLYDLYADAEAERAAVETQPKVRRRPTMLDVYLECLHLIQELPPADRSRVVHALSNFATFGEKLLTCPEAES